VIVQVESDETFETTATLNPGSNTLNIFTYD
jgi:hypothetical protein